MLRTKQELELFPKRSNKKEAAQHQTKVLGEMPLYKYYKQEYLFYKMKNILSRLPVIIIFIILIIVTVFFIYSCSSLSSKYNIDNLIDKTFISQNQEITLIVQSSTSAVLNGDEYDLKKQSNDVFTLYNEDSIKDNTYHDFIIVSLDKIYYETENIYLTSYE